MLPLMLLVCFLLTADKLGSFLNQFPPFPNSFLVGGPAGIFVNELTDQVIQLYLTSLYALEFKIC